MAKEPVAHRDMFGEEIALGQYAVSFESNSLRIFLVEKINPKMITLKSRKLEYTVLRYPKDMLIVPTESVMFKLLRE